MSIGYKLFRTKKGKDGNLILYPLYVFADRPLETGIWLKAECGKTTENGKVKSRLVLLAYRPGWHINDICPYVTHIYTMHGGMKCQKDSVLVWCEVEYSDRVNYQKEAEEAGRNAKGKVIERNAFRKYVPENGFYRYKMDPNMYGAWIIAGAMKTNRILDEDEVEELCRKHGLTPLPVWKKN